MSIMFASGDGGVSGGQSSPCTSACCVLHLRRLLLVPCSVNRLGSPPAARAIVPAFVPTYPAGSPWVTAVGGTQGSNPETGAGLSAGGFSDYWARPSYQMDAVKHYFSVASNLPDPSLYNHTGAGIPDVSAQVGATALPVRPAVLPSRPWCVAAGGELRCGGRWWRHPCGWHQLCEPYVLGGALSAR